MSQISWAPQWIILPRENRPVVGVVQDTLCRIHPLTSSDSFLDCHQDQNILLWVPDWDYDVLTPAIIKPKPLWTGKADSQYDDSAMYQH
jgi:DNA-directed RNA polymerase II subunit RPB1